MTKGKKQHPHKKIGANSQTPRRHLQKRKREQTANEHAVERLSNLQRTVRKILKVTTQRYKERKTRAKERDTERTEEEVG